MTRPCTGMTAAGWLAALAGLATCGIGLTGAETPQGLQGSEHMLHQDNAERMSNAIAERTRMQLERYVRLPDLLNTAHASRAKDVYAEQDRLAREHDAQNRPYRLTMPYRNPGQPCKSSEHHVAMIKYTLVNPARNEKAELWEAELHEAQVHSAVLPAPAATFLEHLTDVD